VKRHRRPHSPVLVAEGVWPGEYVMSEGNEPKFRESLRTTLEIVSESPTLRVGLSAFFAVAQTSVGVPIPVPIGEWIASRGDAIAKERTEQFLVALYEDVEALRQQGLSREQLDRFFESAEWYDLFRETYEQVLRTPSEDKIRYYARLLKGAVRDAESKEYTPHEYLRLLSGLTDNELKVARSLYRLQREEYRGELPPDHEHTWESWQSHRAQLLRQHHVDADDLYLMLRRIASSGLLRIIYIQFPGSPGETYWVTPLFDRLMQFLELRA
jgi:hypothetical protein